MSNLGHDFLSSVPADGAFVRHPSGDQLGTELRDIKVRLKTTLNRKFDLETGDLLDAGATTAAGIPSAALKPISPSPEGEWTQFTVSEKGLITAGKSDADKGAPRVFQAVFVGDSSVTSSIDVENTIQVAVPQSDHTPGGDFDNTYYPSDIFDFLYFEFIVPDGVYRVNAKIVGAGYDHPVGSATDRAAQHDVAFSTTPGAILKVWVGVANGAPSRLSSADGSKYVDSGQVSSPTSFPDVNVGWPGAEIPFWGENGTASSTVGKPGVVLLEWYA